MYIMYHVIKPGKDPRLVWDVSKCHAWWSTPVNNLVSGDKEPRIFGKIKSQYLIRSWNLSITYLLDDIFLCETGFKACFLKTKIYPDTVGMFAFIIDSIMYVPTGMVFGSNTIAGTWFL